MKTNHIPWSRFAIVLFVFFLSCARNRDTLTEKEKLVVPDKFADSSILSLKIFSTFFTGRYDYSHVKSTALHPYSFFIKNISADGKRIRTAMRYINKDKEIDDKLNAYMVDESAADFLADKESTDKRFLVIVNGKLDQQQDLFQLNLKEGRINFLKEKEVYKSDRAAFLRYVPAATNSTARAALPCMNMQPVCTDYYWIEYDPLTGLVYSVTYLYTHCEPCNEAGGGSGGLAPEDEGCNRDALDAEFNTTSLDIGTVNVSQTQDRRTRQYKWKFGSDWFYNYYSVEQGTHKKVGNEWHWERLEHLSVSMSGFSLGVSTSIDQHNGTPYFLSNTTAFMKLSYQITRSVFCDKFPVYKKLFKTSNSPTWDSNQN